MLKERPLFERTAAFSVRRHQNEEDKQPFDKLRDTVVVEIYRAML
jgi:hypothetical protein